VFHSIPNSSIVYIDGGKAQFIDKDILELIEQFQHQAKRRNITVHLEAIPVNI
jgi:anti-anti-sigma regulatory factor